MLGRTQVARFSLEKAWRWTIDSRLIFQYLGKRSGEYITMLTHPELVGASFGQDTANAVSDLFPSE